jgi:hypothetical protein
MKFLSLLLLLNNSLIDSQKMSVFTHQAKGLSFASTLQELPRWTSEPKEYCFLRKELSYFIQYERSPIPIPAFKVNGPSKVYISVDIDPAHPIRFQKLRTDWEELAVLDKNEKICFDGAYLPASNPDDSAYIMIEKIKILGLQLAVQDYWSDFE